MLKSKKSRTDSSKSILEPNPPTRKGLPQKAKTKSTNDNTNTTTISILHHQSPESINNNTNDYIIEERIKKSKRFKKKKYS